MTEEQVELQSKGYMGSTPGAFIGQTRVHLVPSSSTYRMRPANPPSCHPLDISVEEQIEEVRKRGDEMHSKFLEFTKELREHLEKKNPYHKVEIGNLEYKLIDPL